MKKTRFAIMVFNLILAMTLLNSVSSAKDKKEVIKAGVLEEYSGSAGVYTVPKSVKKIGAKAFSKAPGLKKVIVSKKVKSIEPSAFAGAVKLSKISVDNGNKKYASYKGVLYNKKLKKILAVPEGITELVPADNCIISDSCLEELHLPQLKRLTIGSSWRELGESDERHWWNSAVLKSIKVQKNNKVYFIREGNLLKKDSNGKIEYVAYVNSNSGIAEEYTIPEAVSVICSFAFSKANIRKLIIPENVAGIAAYALTGCKVENIRIDSRNNIVNDSMNNYYTIWPSMTYTNCPNLTSVTITKEDTVMPTVGIKDVFPDNIVICSPANSTARTYAEACGYKWSELH